MCVYVVLLNFEAYIDYTFILLRFNMNRFQFQWYRIVDQSIDIVIWFRL